MNPKNLRLERVKSDKIDALFAMLNIDFPRSARMPLPILRRGLRRGALHAAFLTDGSTRCGYAIVQRTPKPPALDMLHVLYLAVLPEYRSQGLGGRLIELLREQAPDGIILDVENPAAAEDAIERAVREKRIAFYERNGFSLLPGFGFITFGYRMRVMCSRPLVIGDWLAFQRALHNHAFGLPLAHWLIRPDEEAGL